MNPIKLTYVLSVLHLFSALLVCVHDKFPLVLRESVEKISLMVFAAISIALLLWLVVKSKVFWNQSRGLRILLVLNAIATLYIAAWFMLAVNFTVNMV